MVTAWPFIKIIAPVVLLLVLLPNCSGSNCYRRLDVVVAVDTTTSFNADDFRDVQTAVKNFASHFKVSQSKTRLALMAVDKEAHLVLNLVDIVDISDFNSAVDSLEYVGGYSNLDKALRFSETLFSQKRTDETQAVFIAFMDARFEKIIDRDMTPDATVFDPLGVLVRSMRLLNNVAIHYVGVGGPLIRKFVTHSFNLNPTLNIGYEKGLDVVKTLNGHVFCEACMFRETVRYEGPCLDHMRQSWTALVTTDPRLTTREKCRIVKNTVISECNEAGNCNKVERSVGTCDLFDRVSVTSSWTFFEARRGMCHTLNVVDNVFCSKKDMCHHNAAADVVILLDKTQASRNYFASQKEAAKSIVNFFNVAGRTPVKVAVMTFSSDTNLIVGLTETLSLDKASILSKIDNIPSSPSDFGSDRDQYRAVKNAIEHMKYGYPGKSHKNNHVVMITTGQHTVQDSTIDSIRNLIAAESVTTYVIGVGNVDKFVVRDLTAPESDSNLFMLMDHSSILETSKKLASVMCVQMGRIPTRLCDQNVELEQLSQCRAASKKQIRFTVSFRRDSRSNKCLKFRFSYEKPKCQRIITDPFSGIEYEEYDKEIMCHKFAINPSFPVSPIFVKPTDITQCMSDDHRCVSKQSKLHCFDELGVKSTMCKCIALGKSEKAALEIEPM